jgi:hypothetical protein
VIVDSKLLESMVHRPSTSALARLGVAGVAVGIVALAVPSCTTEERPECTGDESLALYEGRIEPIITDDRPKSCNQCHLSGIDLGLFVRGSPCRTMACLERRGLVDLSHPEQSELLTWIERAEPQSELITESVIQEEYDAVLAWIRFHATCDSAACEPFDDPCDEEVPIAEQVQCGVAQSLDAGAVTDSCEEIEIERAFVPEVYSWRNRCFPCHFETDDRVPAAPKWVSVGLRGAARGTDEACVEGSLETMRRVVRNGYIDFDEPDQSLLLLKPLSEEVGGVEHGGHAKFSGKDDPAYLGFVAWIRRYARCAAENPSLPRASSRPHPTTDASAEPESPVFAYCNCMLLSCHDEFHDRWGEGDDEAIAGCRTEALTVPVAGSDVSRGDFIECRLAQCSMATVSEDACAAAVGRTVCTADAGAPPEDAP